MKKRKKLASFIVVIIFFVLVVLITLQSVVITNWTQRSVSKLYEEDCSKISIAYGDLVSTRLSEYIKQMRMYTESDIAKTGDVAEIQQWLIDHVSSRTPDFDRIGFVDESGGFYNDQGKLTQVADRDYFAAIMKNGEAHNIDNPVTSKSTGQTIIHVSSAVKRNGKTIGFFCAVVGIDKIAELIRSIKIGRSGYAVLFDSNGDVISSSVVDGKGNALTEDGIEILKTAMLPVVQAANDNTNGVQWVVIEGLGKFFVTYQNVDNAPWIFTFLVDEKQMSTTAREIGTMLGFAGVLLTVFLVIIIGIAVYQALKPLSKIEKMIEEIATGNADLSQRIPLSPRQADNEIGGVIKGFNTFIEKLQTIIASVKSSKEVLVTTGKELNTSTHNTAASITEIIANISSMGQNISIQSDSVQSTAGAVNEIASNIDALNKMVSNQVESVSNASAAVEEMIGNIISVNNTVEKMVASFSDLEQKAINGSEKQEDVNARIERIQNESQSLQEANTVISAIAEQTNLLAMNAAIEAAHAGDAGKGFSVVADEIRKLSETSSSQSRSIGDQLRTIQESISGMVVASSESQESFNAVAAGIRNTNVLVQQIKSAMEEQAIGSKQINETLHTVNDNSSEVKNASTEMSAGNKAILAEIQSLQNATLSMKQGMEEMSIGAKKINETGSTLSSLASGLDKSIDDIGIQIDQFTV
ncbi:MAG: HAMP domain-containing protein [Treponema sp.]|nr:HAMP domain-containing protein [Treponema sp.]